MSKGSRGIRLLAVALVVGAVLAALAAFANGTGVYVNGVELSPEEVAWVQQTIGQAPAAGNYVVANGCVAHLESGQVFCAPPQGAPGGGSYTGPGAGGGYGEYGGEGEPWFHRGGDYSGGYSVGGDGSGCIYTPGWSNC